MTDRRPVEAMARVRRILASKGRHASAYWESRGVARFRRELAADGLSPAEADAIIDEIGHEFALEALDAALQSLRRVERQTASP